MHRLFGKAAPAAPPPKASEEAPPPSLSDTSAKIDLQIQGLEEKIAKADGEIRQFAAKASQPSAKARAMQAMKKKKMYEQQRDQLMGTQFNVDNLAFAQEQAVITAEAVKAMQAGQQALAAQQQEIGVDQVTDLVDDLQELQDEMNEINEVLATTAIGTSGMDEDDLDAEFAALQEEVAAQQFLEADLAALGPAPTPKAAAPLEPASVPAAPAAPVQAAAQPSAPP